MSENELLTAEEALKKYKAPWYYDDGQGDILDAGGHYIMSCYDLGIAEIILYGANEFAALQTQDQSDKGGMRE